MPPKIHVAHQLMLLAEGSLEFLVLWLEFDELVISSAKHLRSVAADSSFAVQIIVAACSFARSAFGCIPPPSLLKSFRAAPAVRILFSSIVGGLHGVGRVRLGPPVGVV